MTMSSLQQMHAPIDREIVRLMIESIPEEWWSFRLNVERVGLPNEGEEFPIYVEGGDRFRESAIPPDALYALIIQHSDIFKKFGKQWRRLTYEVSFDEAKGYWTFKIDYVY